MIASQDPADHGFEESNRSLPKLKTAILVANVIHILFFTRHDKRRNPLLTGNSASCHHQELFKIWCSRKSHARLTRALPGRLRVVEVDDELQDVLCRKLHLGSRDKPLLLSGKEPVHIAARHLQITAGLHLLVLLGIVPPVGHDKPFIPPLPAKDSGEKLPVLRGAVTVDEVIGGHEGMGPGLLHDDLELLQIDLAKCPFTDSGVGVDAVRLLVVARKVLDRCGDTGALNAADQRCGKLTRKERILGPVLEVAAAQR